MKTVSIMAKPDAKMNLDDLCAQLKRLAVGRGFRVDWDQRSLGTVAGIASRLLGRKYGTRKMADGIYLVRSA